MRLDSRSRLFVPVLVIAAAVVLALDAAPPPGDADGPPKSGRALYLEACAGCHGADGRGAPPSQVGFDVPLPDFTDCSFASREPDADWLAVAHQGGPTRAFAPEMPAFGEALSEDELLRAIGYIRSLCGDDAWPRGELNLPRALFTEKAYPEDEAVFTTSVDVENAGSIQHEIVYEQRFGARNQFEIVVPFGFVEEAAGWSGGRLGDVALGLKRALYHDAGRGTILSAAGEVVVATGDWSRPWVFEPFVSFGQILPADAFMHVQAGAEVPLGGDPELETFWRGALGKTLTNGPWGRAWSPMVEVLGSREMVSDAETHWDVVPQLQVTLNRRQHIMANVGVRIPLDDPGRDAQVAVYLLWDWFDGGLTDGW